MSQLSMDLGQTTVTSLGKHGFWPTNPKEKLLRDFDNSTDRRKKQQAELKKKLEQKFGNPASQQGAVLGADTLRKQELGVRTVYRDIPNVAIFFAAWLIIIFQTCFAVQHVLCSSLRIEKSVPAMRSLQPPFGEDLWCSGGPTGLPKCTSHAQSRDKCTQSRSLPQEEMPPPPLLSPTEVSLLMYATPWAGTPGLPQAVPPADPQAGSATPAFFGGCR
eukprot:gene19425-biopygen13023